jgi:HSP20 family protein
MMPALRNRLFWDRNGEDPEMKALLRDFFTPEETEYRAWTMFRPTANLAETETAYEVTVDLPGVKPEDVRVEMHNGALRITGERREEKEEREKTFHRTERTLGRFERVMPLPTAVVDDKIEAAFKDGVLKVTLPKREETRRRMIEVKKG